MNPLNRKKIDKNALIPELFKWQTLKRNKWLIWVAVAILLLIKPTHAYITKYYSQLIPFLIRCIVPGVCAILLMLAVVPLTIIIAKKFHIVVKPEYPKEHLPAVPLLGGVTIFVTMIIIHVIYWPPPTPGIIHIYLGAGIIFVLGTIDDIRPVPSVIRILGQLLASAIIMSKGMVVSFMPDTSMGMILSVIITLVWILGITNAVNFADGVDGLAAGMTAIASFFFFIIAVHLNQYQLSLISAILFGSCLGFLIFNYKPAKIYLGDGGSTTLGFLLASFALYGGWSNQGIIVALGIPVLILGVLIFDMIYITLSRIRNGTVRTFKQWLDHRARDHFHHRLIHIGFKEENAVIFIYILCIILGLSALVLENTQFSYPAILLNIQGALIFVVTSILMLVGREVEKD